jgi:hypothetical protein
VGEGLQWEAMLKPAEGMLGREWREFWSFGTETGAGTDCWPSRRDILGGGWAR